MSYWESAKPWQRLAWISIIGVFIALLTGLAWGAVAWVWQFEWFKAVVVFAIFGMIGLVLLWGLALLILGIISGIHWIMTGKSWSPKWWRF